MIRKTLAVGIILLFIASTVTPAVISIDEPEEDEYFENIAYVNNDENTINGQQIVTKEIASLSNGDDVDWWPQYHHDLQLTGYTTSTAPNTNKVLWTAGSFGMDWYCPQRSSPAVVDDTIYIGVVDTSYPKNILSNFEIGSNDYNRPLRNPLNYDYKPIETFFQGRWNEAYLISMNATTGTENWKTRLPDEFYIMGSAAVADGKVFITATKHIASPIGHLYCLDALNGDILWSFPLNEYWFVSPVVNDGRVYASGWIFGENNTRMCRLYCLNADSGVEIFNTSLGFGEPIDAAAIHNNRVYVSVWDEDDNFGDNYLYCVDALNGTFYWTKNLPGNRLGSCPVIYDDKVYVTTSFYDGSTTISCYLCCLDAVSGDVQWDQYIEGGMNVWATPAVAYDKIFLPIDNPLDGLGWLYCLDASTGDIIWSKFLTDEGLLSSCPAIADGKIYINSMGIFKPGNLYCIDTVSGDIIWEYFLLFGIYSSPAIADGRLYLASMGQFYVFDDSAPANDPPSVTISGPRWGIAENHYNYTITVEDPEGSDLLVMFDFFSLDDPYLYEMGTWIIPSGESEVIGGAFPAGEYLIRTRAMDDHYIWSDWDILNIKIVNISLKPMFLFGRINTTFLDGNMSFISLKRGLSVQFSPFDMQVLSPGTDIVISNEYQGFVGSRFIFGRFQADLI